MLDKAGTPVNTFEIVDWFISSINYGELDYSDDELLSIEVTISYEFCNIS